MANNEGRREVVKDPLAPNAREQRPDRSLAIQGVRAPLTPSDKSLEHEQGLDKALSGVEALLASEFEKKKDTWITEGKVAFQSGVTEQDMLATGNKFTEQGYRTLQARDSVNNWFTKQTIDIDENTKRVDPDQYSAYLSSQREEMLKGITDPTALKVASAAFEDMSPRLATAQRVKNNEYNHQERVKGLTNVLYSTAPTSATASRREPGKQLALSDTPVAPVMQPSERDRDIGIRTMLGEAANEGAEGMAAVAHVMRNRAVDGRWSNSIAGVALEPKQFSAWNSGAGGNSLVRNYGPGHPIYERAGEVFDAVMSGRHVDGTGGATHYYSPAGMTQLVRNGDQPNLIPAWLSSETARSGGSVKIGGHIFVGKTGEAAPRASVAAPATATTLASGTPGDLNAVPASEGVAVTGVTAKGGQNEVQQLIHGYAGLNNSDKATAVADAMRRGLDAGDDSLFRDSGGMATLHSLGAKPGEVDEVLKARERFYKKQQTEFNVQSEKYRDDIIKRAESGEDINVILADIDKKVKDHALSDTAATALAHSASDKVRQQNASSKSKMANTDMLNELGGLYQQIATGSDFKTVADQATSIAKKYDATDADVKQIVGKMFSDNQAYQNKLRNDATTASKTKATEDGVKSEVERAIAKGNGLGLVSGSVKTVNDRGQPVTITAEQYGVQQIKDKWAKQYTDQVAAGTIKPEDASVALTRRIALELQNHNVVDHKMTAELHAGLSGNIMDTKEKSGIRPAATQAYNAYLTLKETPGISPGYLSKVVGDDDTRRLLETAFVLDAGNLSKAEALLKAHDMISDPTFDPNDRIKRDPIWNKTLATETKKALTERTDPGFFKRIYGTAFGGYDQSHTERILADDKTAEKYVMKQADMYYMQNPKAPMSVHLEMATQDLQAHAQPVMGNLIISSPGKEIDKAMGVRDFGPHAADEATKAFMLKRGPKLWNAPTWSGTEYSAQVSGHNQPPLKITYNQEQGTVTFDMYKDFDKKQTMGKPHTFFVKDIGAEYRKEQTAPSAWDKTWNSMFKSSVGAVKSVVETSRARDKATPVKGFDAIKLPSSVTLQSSE